MSTIQKVVNHKYFSNIVISLILLNAIVIGIETYPNIFEPNKGLFHKIELIFLWAFTIEIALRLIATKPWYNFFKSGWNVFDFVIVAVGHIFIGGHLASVLRIIRVLRVLRAITVIPSLQKLVAALFRTIPTIGNIMILLSLIFYVFAVIGTTLFRDISPEYFGSLGHTFITLFQVVTLESWASAVMRPILVDAPWAWWYFVSFVLIGTFVIVNLFVGVIVNNVQEVAVICEKPELEETEEQQEPVSLETEVSNLRKEIAELKDIIVSLDKNKTQAP
ncbi:ion transporter [Desulfuribacillus alkaliarsenatis]|uniref:Voltage-gated sodium channel n=1 Tax=Desulfuribacillus alkaliarsenatis TaxID=766136 RepID=A0A1E5G610_9FIRM|nr:ion transporter [Desulfuribacillus alkaliarsenatis]OEF98593.1 voltage-gated sodium channel [Desulfuribacillus alkaliarsenatis]